MERDEGPELQEAGGVARELGSVASEAPPPAAVQTDPGRELYEQQREVERRISLAASAFEEAEAAYSGLTTQTADPSEIDARIALLMEQERGILAHRTELAALQHRYVLLDDVLFGYRQQARGRAIDKWREQIAAIEHEGGAINAKIAEHHAAIAELSNELTRLGDKHQPITREIQRLEPNQQKAVHVNVRLAVAWKPPAGVLVRASVWRRFIERARAAHLESADIIVDETTGSLVRSPLDQ